MTGRLSPKLGFASALFLALVGTSLAAPAADTSQRAALAAEHNAGRAAGPMFGPATSYARPTPFVHGVGGVGRARNSAGALQP
jgi:hypothetical protein